jgi:lipopolysaccharide transport system ATP-binding protein
VSDIAIRADKLSKQYNIGTLKDRHNTLRDEITEGVKSLLGLNGRSSAQHADHAGSPTTFWALQQVSFEIKKGEVIGIIGRNGAGKSTLLKILSRITAPTEGRAEIHGRVGSLLEVGTGFHGELTGRENIYLNGAILGMKKEEINRKFDEIVAFAEIEKFIDTPVKRYSSGMYVRLAFAVAAHLEPEILIIDEVLAVGDVTFQNKCIGKMGDVARGGRTVLFVSHNMGAVSNLCTAGMVLDQGQVINQGEIHSIVSSYIKKNTTASEIETKHWNRLGTGEARVTAVQILDSTGYACTAFSMGETIVVEMDVEFYRSFPLINLSLEIHRTDMGSNVLHVESQDCGFIVEHISPGKRRFRAELPNCLLYPALYQVTIGVWTSGAWLGTLLDYIQNVPGFSTTQSNITKRTSQLSMHKQAVFYIQSSWQEVSSETNSGQIVSILQH